MGNPIQAVIAASDVHSGFGDTIPDVVFRCSSAALVAAPRLRSGGIRADTKEVRVIGGRRPC